MKKVNHIPAMSPTVVHDYMRDLGREWTGQGTAMELGCWLGATSVPLLEGLVEAGYDQPFWAFDRWKANAAEQVKARNQKQRILVGQDLLPLYLENVNKVYDNIQAHKGNIPNILRTYSRDPIELCMFDAPKRNPTFRDSIRMLIPHFIPGVTVLGLLDYYFYKSKNSMERQKFMAPVNFITKYHSCFTMLREFPDNGSCVFFRYKKRIRWKQ